MTFPNSESKVDKNDFPVLYIGVYISSQEYPILITSKGKINILAADLIANPIMSAPVHLYTLIL